MNLSVIICTYNRAESLRKTLDRLVSATIVPSLSWELLIIDNHSTDHTRDVCQRYQDRIPLKYLFESQQGQSAARNRGIREAVGELLAFTDDDVDIDPNWMNALYAGAKQNPDAGFWGGPVYPRWEVPPPAWLVQHDPGLLNGLAVHYERNIESPVLHKGEPSFIGANMMFRRQVFQSGFRFCEKIGLKGTDQIRLDDTVFINDLLQAGCRGVYLADAKVFHRNSKERMTERYLRQWHVGSGRTLVRLESERIKRHLTFGAPRYLWRQLLSASSRFGFTRLFCNAKQWVPAECAMALTWGQIVEHRSRNPWTSPSVKSTDL